MHDNSSYSQNNSVRCRYGYKWGNFPKATQLVGGEPGSGHSHRPRISARKGLCRFLGGAPSVCLCPHPRPSKVTLAVLHFVSSRRVFLPWQLWSPVWGCLDMEQMSFLEPRSSCSVTAIFIPTRKDFQESVWHGYPPSPPYFPRKTATISCKINTQCAWNKDKIFFFSFTQ